MKLRPSIQWFAEQMERKLRAHDDRDGWAECDYEWLSSRIDDEAKELDIAIWKIDTHPTQRNLQAVIDEAADVANFAMMIADNTRTDNG